MCSITAQCWQVGYPDEIKNDPAVINAYIGTEKEAISSPERRCSNGRPCSNSGVVRYGSIEVLHGVDLTLAPGAVVALLGPNGGGKTTTLKVCSGILPGHRPASSGSADMS